MHANQNALTEGPIWKVILTFAFPIFLGNVFQQFYNAFDSWVVGKYLGDTALAAVSSSGSLIFMMIGFFNGVAMGAGVIIARFFGARDYDAMGKAIHTDIAFGLCTGFLLSAFSIAFTPTILRWMGTPEQVLPESISYFRYYSYGIIFSVMYNIFVGILHAVGDSRHPLYYLIFSTVVNVVLDLLLVAVFKMGVGAAAVATTVSQGVSALLCFLHLLRTREPYRFCFRELRFDKGSLINIIRMGFPAGVQNSVIGLANVVVQSNINSFGAAAMAGCGANSKIEGFAFLPVTCFSQSLSTFVGQNLGAHRKDRVRKGAVFGTVCSVILAECIGIIFFLFAPDLIRFFNDAPEVVDYGARHMRVSCLFYFLLAFSHCAAGIIRGAGKSTVPMFTMLGFWCVLRVTYITIAVQIVNRLETVSVAYPITWTCSGIVFLLYLLKSDWINSFDKLEAKGV